MRTGEGVIDPGDFTVDEKTHQVFLTEDGHENAERLLGEAGLLAEGASLYDPANISLMHHVYAALRANHLYHRDQHYVVQNGEVIIVDEFTGRLMTGRRWSDGLHQAVEAKEGVQIQSENQTLASVTFQNYFRMYGKLAGMTGTADTEAYEFQEIYGLETVVIPPNKPTIRKDDNDLIYKTTQGEVRRRHRGHPRLPRTRPAGAGGHDVDRELRADLRTADQGQAAAPGAQRQAARERGRDRGPGRAARRDHHRHQHGRPRHRHRARRQRREAGPDGRGRRGCCLPTRRRGASRSCKDEWQGLHDQVKANGGLRIIATERHESRRIDNQLRGRSGRQGDPGASRFYLSLDDSLMRIFAGDRVRAIMDKLKMPEGEAIEAGIVNRSIESAQRKVEARNFDIRKQLLEYDDVGNDQRKVIYQQRNEILEAAILDDADRQSAQQRDDRGGAQPRAGARASRSNGTWPAWRSVLTRGMAARAAAAAEVEASETITDDDIVDKVVAAAEPCSPSKLQAVGAEQFTPFMRMVLLQSIDSHWREHLAALDYLRQGIHLRGYAQKNPKQEYKREAFELFCAAARRGEDGGHAHADDGAHPVAGAGGRGGRGHRGAGLAASATSPTRIPTRTAACRTSADVATAVAACDAAGAEGRPQRTLPLRQRQEVQELPRQAGLIEGAAMPVNLLPPDPSHLHAVAGVEIGIAMAGVRKADRRDLTVVTLGRGQQRRRRVHRQPLLRRAGAAVPRAPGQRHRACAPSLVNTGNANAGTGADGLARARSHLRGAGAPSGHRARAGAAVFDRRDHGDAAARAHRGRAAGGAGRCWPPTTGPRRPHAIMTTDTLPKAASRQVQIGGTAGDDHRHQQGRRHDPAEHGDDAGLRGHRRGDRAGADAALLVKDAADAVLQPHHDRRRHLDQRFLHADRHAAGGQRRRSRSLDSGRRRGLARRGHRRGAATGAGHRARRRRRHQVHHGRRWTAGATRPNAARWPMRSRTRRWSRPPSSPATRTWGASWPRSVTPASTTSTRA